ncbi:hypothetical protein D0Z07_7055 [Hyphodiscus hymeniophilus]|uniref:VOC domain-containing protein n=1 Tax=Hyphodiscus hymeniophilus TaxID=353542 RepID=A0A9P7AV65_9HELO|nr:hypothetical protein D0Z07_7055 [Hyphodiscus hymeniophilus]
MPETSPYPVLEVSHLPSASSFYASVLQPLGLHYLSSSASSTPTRLYFGHPHSPTTNQPVTLFALTQATPSLPPQQNLIRLPAPSPSTVESFYKKALLANSAQKDHEFQRSSDDEARAKIQDLDGNMIEAVYSSRAGRRVPTIETASTEKEARRVLAWQEEVARSTVASDVRSSAAASDAYGDLRAPPPYRRAETFPRVVADRPPRLVRRETVTTEHYRNEGERAATEGRGGGSGFTGMQLVGTLLGAAAGGLAAYAMTRSESSPRTAPLLRRASYGEHSSEYPHPRPVETVRVERTPARSYVSTKDPPRYVEYRIAPPPAPSAALAQDLARIEERSHVSRRSRDSERSSRVRSRSELGSRYDRPLTILPPRPRSPGASHVSHRSSHKSHHSKLDAESYVSARSQRTESTVKPVQYVTATPSKVTTTTIRVVPKDEERRSEVSYARHVLLPRSEVSARHVPLPPSVVSGRGYAPSVAPSDSISSVGSKRERERLRDRMSARDRW